MLYPNKENEKLKVRYEHHLNRSKTIATKFVTLWTNNTFIPYPIFIYDKTLLCSFHSYSNREHELDPFTKYDSVCHKIPLYKQLDFGPISSGANQSRELEVINQNPLSIFVHKIRVSYPTCDGDTIHYDNQSDPKSQNILRIRPVSLTDIFSKKVKRVFSGSDSKVFEEIFEEVDENEPSDLNEFRVTETSDFIIPPNTLVKFAVDIIEPTIITGKQIFNLKQYRAFKM
jgi:hypothetical protein